MAATVTGVFKVIDQASRPLAKMERQAKKTQAAFESLGMSMDTVGTKEQGQRYDATQRGLAQLGRETQVTDKGMSGLGRSTQGADRSLTNFGRSARNTGREVDGLGAKLSRFGQAMFGLTKVIQILKFPAIIAAVSLAAQGIGALAGGVTALIPKLTDLGGALAVIPAGLTGMALSAVSVKLAFSGMGKALSGNAEAMKKLTPEAQRFVKTLQQFKPVVTELRRSAQQGLFPGLDVSVRQAQKAVPLLTRLLGQAGATVGNGVAGLTGKLTGKGFLADFGKVAESGFLVVSRLFKVIGHLAGAFMNVGVAARPFTEWLSRMVVDGSKALEVMSANGRETGKLGAYFDRTRKTMTQFGHILKNVWGVLRDVGAAARPLGDRLWAGAEKATKGWAKWTSQAENAKKMTEWFNKLYEPLHVAGQVMKDLAVAWARLTGENMGGLTESLEILRTKGVPAIEKLLSGITTLGPGFMNMVTSLVDVFATLSWHPLNVLLILLNKILTPIDWLLNNVPGLATVISSALMVGSIVKATAAVRALTASYGGLFAMMGRGGKAGAGTALGSGLTAFGPGGKSGGGRFSGLGSKLGGALMPAGLLFAGGQVAGEAVGGGTGKALSNVASTAAAGAIIGSVIPGIGTVGGAVAGAITGGVMSWVKSGAEDDAREAAKKIRKGMNLDKPGKDNVGKGGRLWTGDPRTALAAANRLVALETAKKHDTRDFMDKVLDFFSTDVGDNPLKDKLTPVAKAKQVGLARRQGVLSAQVVQQGALSHGGRGMGVSDITQQTLGGLDRLSITGRVTMARNVLAWAKGMEDKGQVVKGTTDRLAKSISDRFKGLGPLLGQYGSAGTEALAMGMKSPKAMNSARNTIQRIGSYYANLPKNAGKSGMDMRHALSTQITLLKEKLDSKNVTGKLRRKIEDDLRSVRRAWRVLKTAMGEDKVKVAELPITGVARRARRELERAKTAYDRLVTPWAPNGVTRPGGGFPVDPFNFGAKNATPKPQDPLSGPPLTKTPKPFIRRGAGGGGGGGVLDVSAMAAGAASVSRSWAASIGRGDGGLQRQVRQSTRGVVTKFKVMKEDTNKYTDRMVASTKTDWATIGRNIRRPINDAQAEVSKSFSAMTTKALGSLRAMGYTRAQSAKIIAGGDAGTTKNARGGRIRGVGLQDTVPVAPGQLAAPGELIVNRHTEGRIDSWLRERGTSLGREVGREGRPHSAPTVRGMDTKGRRPVPARGIAARGARVAARAVADTGGGLDGFAGGDIVALGKFLQSKGFAVGENPAFGGVAPVHVPTSWHYKGLALDVNADSMPGGEMSNLDRLNAWLQSNYSRLGLAELIWRAPNHFDHLHVAMTGTGTASGNLAGGGVGAAAAVPLKLVKALGSKLRGAPGGASRKSQKISEAGYNKLLRRAHGSAKGGGGGGGAGPPGAGEIVTASVFGGPGDGDVIGNTKYGWAELSNPPSSLNFSALGNLPRGEAGAIRVTAGGKSIVVPKVDVGAGGAGLNGHIRAIDLTYSAAQKLGFSGLGDVRWERAARGGRVADAGWFGQGGTVTANGPTVLGIGESGKETATITRGPAAHRGGGGGAQVKIGQIIVQNHRKGDIKRQVEEEIGAAISKLASDLHDMPVNDSTEVMR